VKRQTASARCGRSAGLTSKAFGDGWVCDRHLGFACQLGLPFALIAFITAFNFSTF
jgi:hypothetical protein